MVVSPFLDRQHGTELCIIEQIERFAQNDQWQIHVYSQRVEQLGGVGIAISGEKSGIVWHRVSDIPGPHLLKYVWWFFANQLRRRGEKRSGEFSTQVVYSPGINCWDADVIVVHIVFAEFYARVRSELNLRASAVRSWPLTIHRKLYYKLIIWLEGRIYRDSRVRLIAVSELVAQQLRSHYGRKDVTVIPNAADTQRFNVAQRTSKRESSREKFGFSRSEFVMLFIGNDWKKKGLEALLRALALLRDLRVCLLVVGSDDKNAFASLLEQPGVQNRVQFQKPSADVHSFYAAADLYIAPALEDAFGLPIVEAMACGLPVIASTHAGASAFVRDGVTGRLLHEPRSAEEIEKGIRLLFEDERLREQMGLAAAAYIEKNCSWDQNAEQTRKVLEETLKQKSSR